MTTKLELRNTLDLVTLQLWGRATLTNSQESLWVQNHGYNVNLEFSPNFLITSYALDIT